MNAILSLQKLMVTDPIDTASTQSICCMGSTQSEANCCNTHAG
jgi:hypothetical protein